MLVVGLPMSGHASRCRLRNALTYRHFQAALVRLTAAASSDAAGAQCVAGGFRQDGPVEGRGAVG